MLGETTQVVSTTELFLKTCRTVHCPNLHIKYLFYEGTVQHSVLISSEAMHKLWEICIR